MMLSLTLSLCALGTAGVLVADRAGWPRLEWLAKPMAALAFILAGWQWGALESEYGRWVLLGLVCGAAGDLLLIPKSTGLSFLLGMLAFLAGHLCYAIAFLGLPQHAITVLISSLVCAVLAILLLRWMMPGVPPRLRAAVLAYHLVIMAMVVLACGASAAGASPMIAVAALAFAASDVAVARNRFVSPGFVNRAWGIPLYFFAQVLMASTVAAFALAA